MKTTAWIITGLGWLVLAALVLVLVGHVNRQLLTEQPPTTVELPAGELVTGEACFGPSGRTACGSSVASVASVTGTGAFIAPDLPPLIEGMPPTDKAALTAYAREGIRAHGPIRRNCTKNRHGFPTPAEITARISAPPAEITEPDHHMAEPEVSPPAVLPPEVPVEPELVAYLPPQRQVYIGGAYFFPTPETSPPVSVPEPGTWCLMLGTLALWGLFGLFVRRAP